MRKERLETELRLQDSLNLDMAKECIKQEIDSISNRQKKIVCVGVLLILSLVQHLCFLVLMVNLILH